MRYSQFTKIIITEMQLNLYQLSKKYPLTFEKNLDIWEEFLEHEYKIMMQSIMQQQSIDCIEYVKSLINCLEIRLSDFCYNIEMIEEEEKICNM